MTNPYYNNLFDIINTYVSTGGSIQDGTKLEVLNGTNPTISVFEGSTASASSVINVAGNYKYTCLLPLKSGDEYPPNYVGVLQENNVLRENSLIYELLTFTNAKGNSQSINCNKLVAEKYGKIFKTLGADGKAFNNSDSDTRMINFTNGLPYTFYEESLRAIHMDVTRRINRMIDYAIRTGQDENTKTYSRELVKRFHEIFFDTADNITKAKPNYYAMRTGILPTAISFAKWKSVKDGKTLKEHAEDYLNDADQLKKGLLFIPNGISAQFSTTNNKNNIYWYPFNVNHPYSYKFIYAKDSDDKTKQSTDDQKYVCDDGFNHFNVDKNESLQTFIYNVQPDTKTVNAFLTTDLGSHPMILSYESSLSNVPAPKTVTVLPIIEQRVTCIDDESECCKRGIRSAPIVSILATIDNNPVNVWANPTKDGTITMHPLLNRSGKDSYLNISTGALPSYVTDGTLTKADERTEIAYYYNNQFTFTEEERAVDRLNYFNDNAIDTKHCDVNKLEFAKITKKLFNVANNNTLVADNSTQVLDNAFGMISKKETANWKTKKLGICSLDGQCTKALNPTAYEGNGLFDINSANNGVPEINMQIRALHYMDPVKAPGNEKWTEGMSCPFREDDIMFLGSRYKNCRTVPQLRMGTNKDPMEWNRHSNSVGDGWKDHEVFDAKVNIDRNSALLATYNKSNLHSLCKAVMGGGEVSEYYYTIHILADDGGVTDDFDISTQSGLPDFTVSNDNETVDTLRARYGTGLQYFFGGVCGKSIYEAYYNKGLTVQQLLNRSEGINSKTEDNKPIIQLSRVSDGLRRANITFEWDYDLLLEAWQLALWIMRGMPDGDDYKLSPELIPKDKNGNPKKELKLWEARNAPLALAAFFDYIYSSKGVRLMLGPSLKQINNFVGPYTTDNNLKGVSCHTTPDRSLVKLDGSVWKSIKNHQSKVSDEDTPEAKKVKALRERLGWGQSQLRYGNRYVNAKDHNLVSMHIFADKDLPIYTVNDTKMQKEIPMIDKNGVGENYWGKGNSGGGSNSPWGTHRAATYDNNDDGRLGLDHYSWDWPMLNTYTADPKNNNELWKGAFMIHAASATDGSQDKSGGKFNWHLGPFHTVSEAGRTFNNAYGVRQGLSGWDQWKLDTDKADGSTCNETMENKPSRMAWHGIKGETHGNQNPNIRVRLPMLWRYLKALRHKNIYTDGQLMPCGVELHYNVAKKAILSSIKHAEVTIPTYADDKVASRNAWEAALCNPSATVFAEVLHDTYAISKATISKWKNVIFDQTHANNMIRDILSSVAEQKPKIVALNRAKIYMDSLIDSKTSIINGKTIFNIPILPLIASFGAKLPDGDTDMHQAIADIDDPLTTIGSTIPNVYKRRPNVEPDNVVPVQSIGIGVTNTPVLNKGVETNQFTAISNALYNDVLSFDGNTFGWIVPIPNKANLTLLNAYDDRWRDGESSVIPLKISDKKDYKATIKALSDKSIQWIGWVVADYIDKLMDSDIEGSVHICNDSGNLDDNAVIRAAMLKITPQWMSPNDFSNDKATTTPFIVKLEIDTRSEGGVELVMIRNTIPTNMTVEYEINNVSLEVKLPKSKKKIINNVTNISYDKDIHADTAVAPL